MCKIDGHFRSTLQLRLNLGRLVVLDEDNKSETQIINWSPAEDLEMLATMLIDCRREAATSVPGDLSQSSYFVSIDKNIEKHRLDDDFCKKRRN